MVEYNSDIKSLEKLPALRSQLEQQGYDIVFLDFSEGAELIQHNAMVLVELLDWINQAAHREGNEETVVMGASMGGQVARFALAWMEQQRLCHNAKLYVSFDSPHRGANIPLGIQSLVDRLSEVWIGPGGFREAKTKLLRPASRQMLVMHFDPNATGPREAWQAWQQSPGSYPSLLCKVAVANGSGQAVGQPGMTLGTQLMRTAH